MPTLRVVTLNMWGAEPPLQERMTLLTAGLRTLNPDVIALQEVRAIPNQLPNQAETLAAALGMSCAFAVATGDEGLAILSKFPIVSSRHFELPHAIESERRIVLGAEIETVAGSAELFTTHLNYRFTDGKKREDQVVALETWIAERASELPKILMGDFNARPESDEIRFLKGLHTIADRRVYYQDAFELLHPGEAGYTWAKVNPYTEKLAFLERDRRIDYIFVTPRRKDGRGTIETCDIVLHQADANGVLPSDHYGLCANIRLR